MEYRVFVSSDANILVEPDSVDISATIDGQNILLPSPIISSGLRRYNMIFTEPGNIRFEGTATRSGVATQLDSLEFDVNTPRVIVNYINDENIKDICIGETVTLDFETRSDVGNLIESINDVEILKPDSTKEILSSTGTGGVYSTQFTFAQTKGTTTGYQFFVTSSSPNHLTSEKTSSVFINALRGEGCGIAECVRSDECSQGLTCENNQCVSIGGPNIPWTLILIVTGILFVIIIVLIVLFIRKRRTPSIGSDVRLGNL